VSKRPRSVISIEVGNRYVSYDTVLGTNDNTFMLSKGDIIEILEVSDIYGTSKIFLQGKSDTVNNRTLDTISSADKIK